MSPRRLATTSTLVLSTCLLAPSTGHADTSPTTLYVNNSSSSNCSDAGTGTTAQPYCTIQAAVAVVNPGQTVYIEPGRYTGPIDITRSGTATAPITITSASQLSALVIGSQAAASAIAMTNVQYVDMSNIAVSRSVGDVIQISGSSNLTLDRMTVTGPGLLQTPRSTTAAGVHVTGGSNGVRVQRLYVVGDSGPVIDVDGGSTGTMLSTNFASAGIGSIGGIVVNDAPQTTITSDTVFAGCTQAVSVGNGSTGAVIENNVLRDWSKALTTCGSATGTNTMTVDATAASSAFADYNVLTNQAGGSEYSWNGNDYATAADFAAHTQQGAHDADNPNADDPAVASIDSANSAAPGALSTDIRGNARVDDPLVPNTGVGPYSYYDRGALETQEPLTAQLQSVMQAPVGGSVPFNAVPSDAWTNSYTYTFDFGDGTQATDTTGVEHHPYTATGTYNATVTITSALGATTTARTQVVVVAPAPLNPQLGLGYQDPLTLTVDWAVSPTDGWSLTSATIDFGDCSAPFTTRAPGLQANTSHTYAVPGNYTVTLTVTDAGGNTATLYMRAPVQGGSSNFTGCGLKEILIVPGTIGGTFPGPASPSAKPQAPVTFGLDAIGSASVGGGSQSLESILDSASLGFLTHVMRPFVDAF